MFPQRCLSRPRWTSDHTGSIFLSLFFPLFTTVSCYLSCFSFLLPSLLFITVSFCIMYNGMMLPLTGPKPGRFARRGVLGLLSFAGEGLLSDLGVCPVLTHLLASHERIFSFLIKFSNPSSKLCVCAVIRHFCCHLLRLCFTRCRSSTRIENRCKIQVCCVVTHLFL